MHELHQQRPVSTRSVRHVGGGYRFRASDGGSVHYDTAPWTPKPKNTSSYEEQLLGAAHLSEAEVMSLDAATWAALEDEVYGRGDQRRRRGQLDRRFDERARRRVSSRSLPQENSVGWWHPPAVRRDDHPAPSRTPFSEQRAREGAIVGAGLDTDD